jgi:hypothetical protein
MSSHGHVIKNPGVYKKSPPLQGLMWALVFIGAASSYALFAKDAQMGWSAFVMNHFYFMSLALGGLFFAAIQWLTGAMWSAPVRRLGESFTAYLPIALLTTVILFFGLHHIYEWTHTEVVAKDMILSHKKSYLEPTFFIARNLIAFLLWAFFAWKLISNSIEQDSNGDFRINMKNRVLTPIFIIFFALSFTMASYDQIMSLDPHWFSTIFGIYCFAGLFYSTLAALCLLTLYFKKQGYLQGIVNDNHLHDIGKFMFAFTVFWAYIGFSQFMLIWYANLPEETGYYLKRFSGGWMGVSIFLLVGKFLTPFFILLPRGSKRSEFRLAFVAVFMLIAQWIDVLWMVQPEFFKEGPRVDFFTIGMTLGFLGLFGLCVSRFLSKHNVVAIGDPRLHESVLHHHQ